MKCEICGRQTQRFKRLPVRGKDRKMVVCQRCWEGPDVMIEMNDKGEVTEVRKATRKDLIELPTKAERAFTPDRMELQIDIGKKELVYREWVKVPRRYQNGVIRGTKMGAKLSEKIFREMGVEHKFLTRRTKTGTMHRIWFSDLAVGLVGVVSGELVPALVYKLGVPEKKLIEGIKRDLKKYKKMWTSGGKKIKGGS